VSNRAESAIARLKVGESVSFGKGDATVDVERHASGTFDDGTFDLYVNGSYHCTADTAGEAAEIVLEKSLGAFLGGSRSSAPRKRKPKTPRLAKCALCERGLDVPEMAIDATGAIVCADCGPVTHATTETVALFVSEHINGRGHSLRVVRLTPRLVLVTLPHKPRPRS